jgi:hypothetical protein
MSYVITDECPVCTRIMILHGRAYDPEKDTVAFYALSRFLNILICILCSEREYNTGWWWEPIKEEVLSRAGV